MNDCLQYTPDVMICFNVKLQGAEILRFLSESF